MYIKGGKSKSGFVLLEVIAFLAVASTLILLYSKIVAGNYIKSSMYNIKDDILTVNDEERALILETAEEINNTAALKETIANNESFFNLNYEKTSNLNNKLKFQIKKGRCFLVLTKAKTVFYREVKIKEDTNSHKYYIIPLYLQGYNFEL